MKSRVKGKRKKVKGWWAFLNKSTSLLPFTFLPFPFRKQRGQSVSEFVLLLSLLTILGIYLMNTMIGNTLLTGDESKGGALHAMGRRAADKIAKDGDAD